MRIKSPTIVGWRNKNNYFGQDLAPIQWIFDLADAFFPGGMPDTILGSVVPESAQNGSIYPDSFTPYLPPPCDGAVGVKRRDVLVLELGGQRRPSTWASTPGTHPFH